MHESMYVWKDSYYFAIKFIHSSDRSIAILSDFKFISTNIIENVPYFSVDIAYRL